MPSRWYRSAVFPAASKAAQAPVAGYDLTFSPVKSVSALWALAAPDVAREVQAAHEAAVRATIGLLEREVAFTRVGKGGIRQVPVTGLVAAADFLPAMPLRSSKACSPKTGPCLAAAYWPMATCSWRTQPFISTGLTLLTAVAAP